eukprot:1444212-Amphidinium_carterae.1
MQDVSRTIQSNIWAIRSSAGLAAKSLALLDGLSLLDGLEELELCAWASPADFSPSCTALQIKSRTTPTHGMVQAMPDRCNRSRRCWCRSSDHKPRPRYQHAERSALQE